MAQDKWQALYAELGVAEHLKGLQRVEMLKKLECKATIATCIRCSLC